MRLDVNINLPKSLAEDLWRIEKMVGTTLKAMEAMMASFEDLTAAQAATDAKIESLKADIEALKAQIVPPGMTADEQAALDAAVAKQNSINDALTAVDAETKPAS